MASRMWDVRDRAQPRSQRELAFWTSPPRHMSHITHHSAHSCLCQRTTKLRTPKSRLRDPAPAKPMSRTMANTAYNVNKKDNLFTKAKTVGMACLPVLRPVRHCPGGGGSFSEGGCAAPNPPSAHRLVAVAARTEWSQPDGLRPTMDLPWGFSIPRSTSEFGFK
jgi:hypothetical protein